MCKAKSQRALSLLVCHVGIYVYTHTEKTLTGAGTGQKNMHTLKEPQRGEKTDQSNVPMPQVISALRLSFVAALVLLFAPLSFVAALVFVLAPLFITSFSRDRFIILDSPCEQGAGGKLIISSITQYQYDRSGQGRKCNFLL